LSLKADHDSQLDYHGHCFDEVRMNKHVVPPGQTKGEWSSADAKARLSELIERAELDGPQMITRNGRPRAVVLSPEDWERLRPRGSLYRLARSAPADFGEISFDRKPDAPRGDVF
jgi:prevent-host-death family protein